MAIGRTNVGGAGASGGEIKITAPAGVKVIAVNTATGKTHTRTANSNGEATFKGLPEGNYEVHIEQDGQISYTLNVVVAYKTSLKLGWSKVYGISRDITDPSPVWTRTNDAVGMNATATNGTAAGASDFSLYYPWREITRVTLPTGDVMVKIPRFWFRRYRDGNIEHIEIADTAIPGYTLHPAFAHSGVEKDCIYVGAYKSSNNNRSVSGAEVTTTSRQSTFQEQAAEKGAGWRIFDISTLSAIQMLILVEFATNDTQGTIGKGISAASSVVTGTTDSVIGLTGSVDRTNELRDVVWRGLEGLWGNVPEHIGGLYRWYHAYTVTNSHDTGEDSNATYATLSYDGPTGTFLNNGAYIMELGLDTEYSHIMLPTVVSETLGSEDTYYCDAYQTLSGDYPTVAMAHGGFPSERSGCGLFAMRNIRPTSDGGIRCASRLIYIP